MMLAAGTPATCRARAAAPAAGTRGNRCPAVQRSLSARHGGDQSCASTRGSVAGPATRSVPLGAQLRGDSRRRGDRHVAQAAALDVETIRAQSLQLDKFDSTAVTQGVAQLREKLGVSEFEIDDATLAWFLRDRKLDQDKAGKKVKAYLAWRAQGNDKLSYKDVQAEASTGKASLLSIRDVLGRPVVRVKVALNNVDDRDLAQTERLCVVLMDDALRQLKAEGYKTETIMVIFDMRNFSLKNADLPFIRFFIKIMFDYYPKRISQVLLVAAPLAFQPMWQVVKPLLGKYSALVRFVSVSEAEAFFPDQPGSGSPLI